MAPLTAWLPVRPERISDLVLKVVGTGTASLLYGTTALEHALTDQGFRVMAQASKLGGGKPGSAVRMRISTEAITSMGSGCDVATCVDRPALQETWLGLQPGSVLVHEAGDLGFRTTPLPAGVIDYPVPFADLHRRCGPRFAGKGFIAAGVLTHLLSIPLQVVRCRVRPVSGLPYFDAGVKFASTYLEKRDIYALPAPADTTRQTMLDARQALLAGLMIGNCDCGPACAQALDRSPDEWVAEHAKAAWGRVSSVTQEMAPSLQGYRSSDGGVTALLGVVDPPDWFGRELRQPSLVLVAADMLDAIRLASLPHRMGRTKSKDAWVVVDEILASRQQSVPVEKLVEIAAGTEHDLENKPSPLFRPVAWWPNAEWDSEPGASVGYVAWGTAQGVVREAVALCRSFGLHVAALYPKVLNPMPTQELEAFAKTVEHLVIVESTCTGCYTRLIHNKTSLPTATVMPQPGQALTPMDIFMREGLGA